MRITSLPLPGLRKARLKRRLLPLTLTLGAAAALLLTACGGDESTAAGAAAPGQPSTKAAPSESATTPAKPSAAPEAAAFRAMTIPAALADGQSLGSPGAKLTLTVYEDFQCPFCLAFTLQSEPVIIQEYVATGKVRYEFHNLPILGDESVLAAAGAGCAVKQGNFWEYHRRLFLLQADAGQLKNERVNVGRFAKDALTALAGEAGLDAAAFSTCLGDPATLAVLNQEVRAAQQLGLRSTPSFFVDGQPIAGGTPGGPAAWRKFLDDALKGR
jgi:protein-disulfide isomerase